MGFNSAFKGLNEQYFFFKTQVLVYILPLKLQNFPLKPGPPERRNPERGELSAKVCGPPVLRIYQRVIFICSLRIKFSFFRRNEEEFFEALLRLSKLPICVKCTST